VDSAAYSAGNAISSTPIPNPPANVANILSSLLKAGVLSTSGISATVKSSANENETSTESKETSDEAFEEYRSAILSENVGLNTLDLAKTTPRIIEFLYDRLNSQCKQCGIRFPDTDEGKKTMDDHLDMHFRQNRKANQDIGRGHSRSWFIGIEDWIQDISGDRKGKGRADGSGRLNAKDSAAAEDAKREANLHAQYVIVPPGDEAQVVSCPICKETLKSEFLEDDEDWVWKNAIKKDDRIFHATCHAQALSLTSSFAAKLRTEKLNGSRSGTPEVQTIITLSGLRSTPPTFLRVSRSLSRSPSLDSNKGTKRKVDDHGDLNLTDEKDLPPLKKIALSPLTS
jgi:pre-mRNA cleavage complex 2 protein Pcf11